MPSTSPALTGSCTAKVFSLLATGVSVSLATISYPPEPPVARPTLSAIADTFVPASVLHDVITPSKGTCKRARRPRRSVGRSRGRYYTQARRTSGPPASTPRPGPSTRQRAPRSAGPTTNETAQPRQPPRGTESRLSLTWPRGAAPEARAPGRRSGLDQRRRLIFGRGRGDRPPQAYAQSQRHHPGGEHHCTAHSPSASGASSSRSPAARAAARSPPRRAAR